MRPDRVRCWPCLFLLYEIGISGINEALTDMHSLLRNRHWAVIRTRDVWRVTHTPALINKVFHSSAYSKGYATASRQWMRFSSTFIYGVYDQQFDDETNDVCRYRFESFKWKFGPLSDHSTLVLYACLIFSGGPAQLRLPTIRPKLATLEEL